MALLLFLILWSIRKRLNYAGTLFGIYLVMNGFERFMIEKIRVNTIMEFAGLHFTQAELISSVLMLLGLILIVFSLRKKMPVKNLDSSGTSLA
ncbi:MAG: prolipoprotein diacylglyceryl transferase family protein, partial [Chitinophagaceae bacterium]